MRRADEARNDNNTAGRPFSGYWRFPARDDRWAGSGSHLPCYFFSPCGKPTRERFSQPAALLCKTLIHCPRYKQTGRLKNTCLLENSYGPSPGNLRGAVGSSAGVAYALCLSLFFVPPSLRFSCRVSTFTERGMGRKRAVGGCSMQSGMRWGYVPTPNARAKGRQVR